MLLINSSFLNDNSCLSAAELRVIKIIFSLKKISVVLLAMISPTMSFQPFLTENCEIFTSNFSCLNNWLMASPSFMRLDFLDTARIYKYFFGEVLFMSSLALITFSFNPFLNSTILVNISLSEEAMICAAKIPAFCEALTATVATGTPFGI